MKLYLKLMILGLISSGLLFSCSKKNAKSAPDACCQRKQGSTQKSMEQMPEASENSIYQLTDKWTNAKNEKMELKQLKGKVQLVAMIFTHCGYACPAMVANMKNIEKQLPENIKNEIGFVLVSFDVLRDTPERLEQYTAENSLDQNWTLLHGDADQVRMLSMLLHIQYNQQQDGNFNHSNSLTVLDKQGNIVKQFEGLDIKSQEVIRSIEQIVKS